MIHQERVDWKCVCGFAKSEHRRTDGRRENPAPYHGEHSFKRAYIDGKADRNVIAECECGVIAVRQTEDVDAFRIFNFLTGHLKWSLDPRDTTWRCANCTIKYRARKDKQANSIYDSGAAHYVFPG